MEFLEIYELLKQVVIDADKDKDITYERVDKLHNIRDDISKEHEDTGYGLDS